MSGLDPILIDMDGVMEDWYGSVLRQLAQEAAKPGGHNFYDLLQHLPCSKTLPSWDIDGFVPSDLMKEFLYVLNHPSIFHETEAIGDYKTAFEQLEEETGRKVFICTFPSLENPGCIEGKMKKVKDRLGKKWLDRLILTKDKSVVNGVVLVDDKPTPAGEHTPSWEHIVFDQPWNRAHQQGKPVITGWCDRNVINLINIIQSK